jgi:hypothetical protein
MAFRLFGPSSCSRNKPATHTSREQLITHLEANDAGNLIDLAGQYLDAWCTKWKAERQAECEARQREPLAWGDQPF